MDLSVKNGSLAIGTPETGLITWEPPAKLKQALEAMGDQNALVVATGLLVLLNESARLGMDLVSQGAAPMEMVHDLIKARERVTK